MRSNRCAVMAFTMMLAAACGGDDAADGNAPDGSVDAIGEKSSSNDIGRDLSLDSPVADGVADSAPQDIAMDTQGANDALDAPTILTDARDGGMGPSADAPDSVEAPMPIADANGDSDAVGDASDGSSNADITSADASDAAPSCIALLPGGAQIAGDYYIRTDGSTVNGQSSTVVLNDATGMPLVGITQIVLERYGACALRGATGDVFCWASFQPAPGFGGNNASGQLGNGTFVEVSDSAKFYRATKVQISSGDSGVPSYLGQVTSLQTGSADPYSNSVCAIRSDKSLWCWGATSQGNLWSGTIGSNADLAFATKIALDIDGGTLLVDQVTMGNRHMCFLSSGELYCWGANIASEVGTGDTTAQTRPYHVTSLPSGTTFVGAGSDVTCAIVNGNVYCWGTTNSSTTGDPYVDASICNANFCQPTPRPVLTAFSDGGLSQTQLTGQVKVFVGYQFACAADAAGLLRCWGASGTQAFPEATVYVNPGAASGVPSGPIVAISAVGTGGFNSALRYVTADGTLVYGAQKKAPICQ